MFNNATSGAGAILNGENATIDDSQFINNTAVNGTGVVLNADDGSINNSEFINNTASETGAGILICGNYGKVKDSKLINNRAGSGAGIYVNGDGASVENSTLKNNTAADNTNDIALDNGSVVVDNLTKEKSDADVVLRVVRIEILSVDVSGYDVSVKLKVHSGNSVNEGMVFINLNGKTYYAGVYDSVATLTLSDLSTGSYTNVSVDYYGFSDYGYAHAMINFTVESCVSSITSKNVNMFYLEGSKYVVRAVDAKGKEFLVKQLR